MLNFHQILSLCLLTFFTVSVVFGQEDKLKLGKIEGGVLNGRATSLVKPSYPPAAKAVRASGAVNVQVLIDENGDVVSASATSGHPLLRAAAVQAARASKFKPTTLSGQPVKVNGVIVYNFVGDGLNAMQIGFALSSASFAPKLGEQFPAFQILNSFSNEWSEERKQAQGLSYKQNEERAQIAKNVRNKTQQKADDEKAQTVVGVSVVSAIGAAKPEVDNRPHTEIANNLTDLLKNRYTSDQNQNWSFELGLALGKIQSQINDDAALRLNLSYLNQLVATAPTDTNYLVLTNEIKILVAIAEKAQIEVADKDKIERLIKSLRLK